MQNLFCNQSHDGKLNLSSFAGIVSKLCVCACERLSTVLTVEDNAACNRGLEKTYSFGSFLAKNIEKISVTLLKHYSSRSLVAKGTVSVRGGLLHAIPHFILL